MSDLTLEQALILLDESRQHNAAMMDRLYESLGIDDSDGEVRFKWVMIEIEEMKRERNELAAQLASLSKHDSPLQHDLVIECERAMKQRDEYLRTKVSTAGHGGSHDTCFTAILRNHIKLNEQHLRDVRAEAGRAGYLACLHNIGYHEPEWQDDANNYAESVKAGER